MVGRYRMWCRPIYYRWAAGIYAAYVMHKAPRAPLSMSAWIRIKKDLDHWLDRTYL